MRWIIYGTWLVVITSCITKPDTIGIEDRFYRFNNDAYERQIGEQGSYLKQIGNIQTAAKEEKQRFNNIEDKSKYQKQAFLSKLNNAEVEVGLLTKIPKLDTHVKQVMEAITRLKRQAIIQPKILSSHKQQMDSINDLIKQMQKIANTLK
ncbi:hypothetical protein QUF74_06785 [Candidatus Halobeggiatoa sp. HSG11]|nr:hypothetical protein [Candidatus Halobeggiatoa sp. HSG11]